MDIENICTPIKAGVLSDLLRASHYDKEKTDFLVKGFTEGFSIHYEGPRDRKSYSNNLKLTVGSHLDLWNKVMTEVSLGRFGGPFETVPYDFFAQSPIGYFNF